MVSDTPPLPPSPEEPIAVVGIGCRFPGGIDSPQAFWRLLTDGAGTSGPVPEDRWAPQRALSRENAAVLSRVISNGSFLDDISGFDAAFFGMSATEARQLDPQQRMALEVAWEALEHAGIPATGLAGTDTGVFIGVGTDDYGRRLLEDLPGVEAWTGIGSSLCGVPNRISYTLDLRGPSLAVDTACSSSLVALHQACAALRSGEVPVALAGGVMLMAGPGLTTVLDVAGAISPDGRSKAFDEAADGYGRGEGCGVVVLKRLSDARRDGDRVLALVRGSAVHQDGRTDGIMAPSPAAQAHLLRRAYRAAGVAPGEVDYVEAHGTGTKVGDPIEAAALAEVVGDRAEGRGPCLIGSVKTNIGHCESAAGVAGLIKTVLAMEHGVIPPTLSVAGPRKDIPWATSGLRLVAEPTPWPETGRPRLAGVASYGYGGTIAHAVLEQAPAEDAAQPQPGASGRAGVAPAPQEAGPTAQERAAAEPGGVVPAPREAGATPQERADADPGSAAETGAGPTARERAFAADAGSARERGARALTLYPVSSANGPGLAAQAGRLAGAVGAHPLRNVGHTLAHRRAHLAERAAVVTGDREELAAALAALAAGEAHPALVTGDASGPSRAPVWVFSGHGAQWSGMGRELLADEPVFAAAIDRLGPIYAEELGLTPREVLTGGDLGSVDTVQSMLFAMQIGLAEVWRHYGVVPGAIIGHSVGEIAAAVAAGVLDEADGARLVCRRSALLRKVAGMGAMIMVDRPFDEVAAAIGTTDTLCAAIAAAPSSTVVAGDIPAVDQAAERWAEQGWTVRRVDSDVAFHSAHMTEISADLALAVADLEPRPARVPLYLTAVEDPRSGRRQDASYWAANLREPVRFADAVRAAAEDGHRTFLEVSAHPVVSHSVTETTAGIPGVLVVPTLRRNKPERATLLASLARLHCAGVPVDWPVLQPAGHRADLPTRAWQHERHWVDARGLTESPADTLLGTETAVHGARLRIWRTTLDLRTRPYPRRHPVQGTEIIPAAVLVNTFLTAGRTEVLTDLRLRQPVVVPREETREVQVVRDDGGLRLVTRRLGAPDTAWSTHTLAAVGGDGETEPLGEVSAPEPLDPDHVVDRLAELGVADMGYPWRIDELRRGDGVLTAVVTAGLDRSWAAVLDAALSMASVIFTGPAVLRMPAHIDRVSRSGPPPRTAAITVTLDPDRPTTVHVDVRGLPEAAGGGAASLCSLRGLRYGELDGNLSGEERSTSGRFDLEWQPFPVSGGTHTALPGRTVLVLGPDPLARSLVPACAGQGATVSVDATGLAEADHVLYAPGDAEPVATATGFTRLVGEIAALPGRKPRLWCLTSGVRAAASAGDLGGAPLWGMGRVAASEHPEFWGGVVDVPAGPLDQESATLLLDLLPLRPPEPVLSVAGGAVQVPRLVPAAPAPDGEPFGCRADGTYLITGGLGVLGLELAEHLAQRGARRIVLLGRTPLPPRAEWSDEDRRTAAVRRLEAAGVTVATLAVDITDREAVRTALAGLRLPPVRGVVHAAGTVHSALLHQLEAEALREVMRPKVDGARVLHELFPPGSTDFFVLFSSAGPLLGLPGQGAYAAANACLDALAAHRRALGGRESVSIAWTSWRGMGMATAAEATDVELAARGTADIAPDRALRAFDQIAAGAAGPLVAVLGLLRGHRGPRPALLAELAPDDTAQPAEVPDWVGLSGEELAAYLLDDVRRRVAAVLGLRPDAIGVHRPLTEAGVDSLLAAAVRVALERDLGVALPATLLWNYPTVSEIAGFLAGVLATRAPDEAPAGA
ncbi:type I polyketide synthase [Streptomyces lichenis]|uniref:SDR family NAD(P)-dependent oxidoreductase n=1 Tax=Streptomyces lichenis TaxID=2306967 RepID=A0ABT0IF79_9ACTN|nr:type I polyketide synthase [Streptomyces lichenis]MCK8679974.1 SDR family NAD(P)-dependent oxidoreductase [Streptomyces lichenis]